MIASFSSVPDEYTSLHLIISYQIKPRAITTQKHSSNKLRGANHSKAQQSKRLSSMATTISIGALLYRRPDSSPTSFRTHLETKHIPLVLRLISAAQGSAALPSSTPRYYLAHSKEGVPMVFHGDTTGATTGAVHGTGTGDAKAGSGLWDCFSVFEFRDQAHLALFKKGYDACAVEIKEDEARFLDLDRTVVGAYAVAGGADMGMGNGAEKETEVLS